MNARLLATLAAAALLLAGCGVPYRPNGEAGKPAARILADAAASLRHADSYRIDGTWSMSHGDTTSVDAEVASGGRVEFTSGDRLIVLPGQSFRWQGRRWVRLPDNIDADPNQVMAALVEGAALSKDWLSSSPHIPVTKGRTGRIDGVPAIQINNGYTVVWVALTGTPYPLRIIEMAGGTDLSLQGFDQQLPITAPPHAVDYYRTRPGRFRLRLSGALTGTYAGSPDTCAFAGDNGVTFFPNLTRPVRLGGMPVAGMYVQLSEDTPGAADADITVDGPATGEEEKDFSGELHGKGTTWSGQVNDGGPGPYTLTVTASWSC